MSRNRRQGGFFSGLILGGLVGAGLFHYLTKTEEGKKLKKRLVEKSQDALDNLADTVSEFEQKGEEFKKKAQKIQRNLEKKAQDARREVAQEAQKQLNQVEKLRQKGQAAKRFFTKGGRSLSKPKKAPSAAS